MPLRSQVLEATNKMEAFNDFSQWIRFGGEGIISARDPIEQEKRIKYKDLIANANMLQNVVDITNVLHRLIQEGETVTPELVATFSPYLCEHIKRFGEYVLADDSMLEPVPIEKAFLSADFHPP